MLSDISKGFKSGGKEGAIELIKQIVPFSGVLIESVRKYQESIEEQQREDFVSALCQRVKNLEENAVWYQTKEGEQFVRKVVATALNAEHADKLEFLANALANGPNLNAEDGMREKFVELIRQLSKPSLEVLTASLQNPSSTGRVMPGDLAGIMGWPPELVEACVTELSSSGAFSSTISWFREGNTYRKDQYFDKGTPSISSVTKRFAEFISDRTK